MNTGLDNNPGTPPRSSEPAGGPASNSEPSSGSLPLPVDVQTALGIIQGAKAEGRVLTAEELGRIELTLRNNAAATAMLGKALRDLGAPAKP